MTPPMTEAQQMLKFYLKKLHLSFTKGWATSEMEMAEEGPNDDLLGEFLGGSQSEDGDKILHVINSMVPSNRTSTRT